MFKSQIFPNIVSIVKLEWAIYVLKEERERLQQYQSSK